ncbi:MAG: hypothetical protein WBW62_04890 [Solirubrobacterales bacterium]
MSGITFDQALAAILGMVGQAVDVHLLDAGENPQLVAAFGGRLEAGYSLTGGEPNDEEAIFVRLVSGDDVASLNLNRELYRGGMIHPDGGITLHSGSVDLMISRRAT